MHAFERAVDFLPDGIGRALLRIPPTVQARVQEIRLRRHAPLLLSLPEGEKTVDSAGTVADTAGALALICTAEDIETTFLKLCEYSVHSHMAELREGFVTAKGGLRAGVAGTAVTENGAVTAVRDIRSLCLRVAARYDGCALALRPLFRDGIPALLLAGEPSAGKTSMLRDIGRMLSDGSLGRRYRVAVVDERGELAGTGGLENADVLTGCPKPRGILQAVRTLAPDVILLDELGTLAEVEAMTENLHAGVPAIATVHCRSIDEALRRPAVQCALRRRVFDKLVLLRGRDAPGEIRQVVEVNSLEAIGSDRHHTRRHAGRGADERSFASAADGAGHGAVVAR